MKEDDRQRTIRQKLARMESKASAGVIPTGLQVLDAALGVGGLPRGGITELFGASSSGKTTLALQTIAHLQQAGGVAGWIDADHTFDPAYAGTLGVSTEHLPVAQPESAEQALEITRQLAASGALDLVVIDSAAALVPRLELEAGIGESGHSLHGRVLASGLRGLSAALARTGTAVVFLNQVRIRPELGGNETVTSAGGPALKLYASVRIALGPCSARRVRFRILKNKAAGAFAEGELGWNPGQGFAEHL